MNQPIYQDPPFPSRRRKRRRILSGVRDVACVFAIPAALLALVGCAPLDAQSNLLTQARRGIDLAQSNRANCASVHEQYAKLKRQRLDDAFDADVREQDQLTADWVIDHRAAYAVALEAFAHQQRELDESDAVARRNLHAVDVALERLQFLQSIQNRWLPALLPEDEK
ncbi:MAG: hypothetical protein WBD40_16460 [Tepidisphaeraceae bacterium]